MERTLVTVDDGNTKIETVGQYLVIDGDWAIVKGFDTKMGRKIVFVEMWDGIRFEYLDTLEVEVSKY